MDGTRILICEDDTDSRWAFSKVLRQHGAIVVEAQDGREGLKFLSKERYDLLVSDVCMPHMGGFGVFAALRFGAGDAYSEHREMPIVLMSGQTSGGEIARALDAGVDEFLGKPLDPAEFVARLKVVLRRARSAGVTSCRTAGSLVDFGMAPLTQALNMAGRTCRVRIQRGLEAGLLDFHVGEIAHATFERPGVELKGDEAALAVLALKVGSFEILPLPDRGPHTVFEPTPKLLLVAAARTDEASVRH